MSLVCGSPASVVFSPISSILLSKNDVFAWNSCTAQSVTRCRISECRPRAGGVSDAVVSVQRFSGASGASVRILTTSR